MKNGQRTIGELARQADVPPRTIRFYEQAGLMPPSARLASGYRVYSTSELRRLLLIKHLRALRLTVSETRDLVDRAFGMECAEYRDELVSVIEQRLADVERRLRELRSFRGDLRALLAHVRHVDRSQRSRVADCAFCPLIDEGLPEVRKRARRNGRHQKKRGRVHVSMP